MTQLQFDSLVYLNMKANSRHHSQDIIQQDPAIETVHRIKLNLQEIDQTSPDSW